MTHLYREAFHDFAYKTLLDHDEHAFVDETLKLKRVKNKSDWIRQLILQDCQEFHKRNSIGREPKQQALWDSRISA